MHCIKLERNTKQNTVLLLLPLLIYIDVQESCALLLESEKPKHAFHKHKLMPCSIFTCMELQM